MTAAFFARQLLRESRGASFRLAFFVVCLASGVAAIVAVSGFSSGLANGIRSQARQLLAGDVAVQAYRPLSPKLVLAVAGLTGEGATSATVVETVTVVSAPGVGDTPGKSQLVELKAVDGPYPFFGDLVTDPARPLSELLDDRSVLVAGELLVRLGLVAGDSLRLGGLPFRVAGVVVSEPDRIGGPYTLGPRVLLSGKALARTGLEGLGSRVLRKTLLKLPPTLDVDRVKERLLAAAARDEPTPRSPGGAGGGAPPPNAAGGDLEYRVETYREAQPALREALARVDRFLALVALLSLLVGGIGVAQTVRAWIASRLDAIAIQVCLGLRPREVLLLALAQTALLGLLGSLLGAALGTSLLALVPRLVVDVLPVGLVSAFQPAAILRGVSLGVLVSLIFSVPPLTAALRVPPARVLRHDAEPIPASWLVSFGLFVLVALGVVVTASLQARSLKLGGPFTLGLLAAAAFLSLAARGLLFLLGRVPRERVGYLVRHPLASLTRPGGGTVSSIVALGLGVLVVLVLALVQARLSGQLRGELPKSSPTAFLIDVQPDQWENVRALLGREGATRIDSVPVVMARLSSVDGRSVSDMAAQRTGNQRWALTREQRLTTLEKLADDNSIVESSGKELWSDPARPEVSVEVEFARSLGARLGSTLTFDVQGVALDLVVTSLRTVNWRTFGINFFFVVEPGVLDAAPQTRLAVARLPKEREGRIRDLLARDAPNVTLLDVRELLAKIAAVIDRLGGAVRFLGAFTVIAGIVILAGSVSASSARRGREAALVKTLGATRAAVAAIFGLEYALVGLVAGLIGAALGTALAWLVLTQGFDLGFVPDPLAAGAAVALAIVLTVVSGLLASVPALRRRPIEALRSE